MRLNRLIQTVILVASIRQYVQGLNYTGETALLDAAPADPSRRHATAVTFGELGVFDFRGDGRARVALELGAFSSEKKETTHAQSPSTNTKSRRSADTTGKGGGELSRVLALGTNEINRPVRDTEPIELDYVYLIFARSRAVNNFVARLHSGGMKVQEDNDDMAATMLCSNVGGWLESEFIAPITALRRPKALVKEEGAVKESSQPGTTSAKDTQPKISFISASSPSAQVDLLPRPTRVTAAGTMGKRDLLSATTASSATAVAGNSTSDGPLLGADTKPNDVFLVEYEWEWLVPHGGEYAVVIANCAATTIQFKYNLIMANRWGDGQWTNVPAGWMPVQLAYPATCYSMWAVAMALWVWAQVRHRMASSHGWRRQPLATLVVGFVPVLRFMSCVADLSRHNLWGSPGGAAYEVTMVVVSTSLVDALADAAQMLVLLALAKGWGVVRARLAGAEKRLVPGLIVFVGVGSLYDGATRGGGVLAVGVLECVALAYAWASLAHTRQVHAVQTLRLVSRHEQALTAWWAAVNASADQQLPTNSAALMLRSLASRRWSQVHADITSAPCGPSSRQSLVAALALMWSATQKDRLLARVQRIAVPLQALDVAVLLVASFAVPPHYAFVGLLLVQAAHWVAFMAVLATIVAGGLESPDVALPALPAIVSRRSIPLPPPNAATTTPRPLPPLGRLHLLRSSAPFAATSSS
ncbi:hypothetical protein IW140_000650 [Coemansia sp. RSA 1813]|nr:hypothetical protein EV178_003354 [Coemansia sp. RSA 1646]KAJ1774118.1 hypothetical protein LPJ74_000217 [Coemansia sp. RSA 1843]KAJ2572887.1 hypothetical protein IW140_000650 [Coemansia sp. RSA 1813]